MLHPIRGYKRVGGM